MTVTKKLAGVLFVLALLAIPAVAHHSFLAEFDQSKPVRVEGKLTLVKFSNPHGWVYIDVVTDGKTVNWAFETGAANNLLRQGWRKEDFPAGAVLIAEGWRARNGSATANARSITFKSDGRRLFAGTSNPNAPTAEREQP
jgi:hypothetical protein